MSRAKSPSILNASASAQRALAKCGLAMCFEHRIEAPPALCDVAMQLGIPAASAKRLERRGFIIRQPDGWRLTAKGAEILRSAGVRVPRQIVERL